MLRQTLKHQLAKPAEESDPFAGVGCRPRGALNSEPGVANTAETAASASIDSPLLPEAVPTDELLKHLGDTIRNRVVPWEKNLAKLFGVLRAIREGDGALVSSTVEPDGSYRYTDPIHGERSIPPWFLKLIDTAPFIRLAGVGQQTASMTERGRGVSYSRCTHSIGAGLLALDMAEKLGFDGRETRLLTSLALYHDARHAPFSHIFDHEIIFGKVFDHDARAIDFLRAPDVANAFDNIELSSEEIAACLKDPQATPYGYLAKVILDRVDYVQRDAIYSGLFSEKEIATMRRTAQALLDAVVFDRSHHRIVFPAHAQVILEDFVAARSETFRRTAFDPATQVCNAYLRRALDRVKQKFPSEGVAGVFLETSTYMIDDELLRYFSGPENEALRRGAFEKNIASLVVIRAEDMTEKGMEKLRVKHLHEFLFFTCGPRFYCDFDPLVVRVPRIPPSMRFTLQKNNGTLEETEINPAMSSHKNARYGYHEIRICCDAGDVTQLREAQQRIVNSFRKEGYITDTAQIAVPFDDLSARD
jgi:HD superfamily phosphohydrolase